MSRFAVALAAGACTLALASATHAADLIIEEPIPGVVDVSSDWEGPYVGVFGGYGWGTYEDDGPTFGDDADLSGWLLGVAAGANFVVTDGIVAGVVADVAWADIGFDLSDQGQDFTFDIDWLASVRGKLGFDGGAFLPYLTAGLAVAGATTYYYDGLYLVDESQTHFGWTVGAGVEFAVADNLSIDLLYRYSDYGDVTYAGDTAPPYEASFTTNTVSVGLNFSF